MLYCNRYGGLSIKSLLLFHHQPLSLSSSVFLLLFLIFSDLCFVPGLGLGSFG